MQYQDINGKTGFRDLKGNSGKTYGNTRLFTDEEKQAMLADGITEWTPPPKPAKPEPTLEELKATKAKQINSEREQWLESDYAEVTYNGNVYQADGNSREAVNEIITAIAGGVNIGTNILFRDKANNTQSLTHNDMKALAELMVNFKYTAYSNSWALKAQIDACTTKEELETTETVQVPVVDSEGNQTGTIDREFPVIRWAWPVEPEVV